MIEIRQLRHVLALAEHANFKRAAKSLGISQPALTKSIQRLEGELDVVLFDRRSKSVVPTQFGQAVVERARRVTAEYDAIPAEIDLLAGLHRGELVIGAGPLMAETLIADAIVRLIQRHPKLRIVIHIDDWRTLTESLHRGDISLFVAETSEAVADRSLEVEPLPTESGFWIARKGHPLASRKGLTLNDILSYPTISTKIPERIVSWLDRNRQSWSESASYLPNVECDDFPLIKRIVRASDCISYFPQSIVKEEVTRGELETLDVLEPIFETSSGIITLRERSLPPAARAFIAEIKEIAHARKPSSDSDSARPSGRPPLPEASGTP